MIDLTFSKPVFKKLDGSSKAESSSLIPTTLNFSAHENAYQVPPDPFRGPRTGEGKNRQSNDMKAPNLYRNTLLLNPQNKRKTP